MAYNLPPLSLPHLSLPSSFQPVLFFLFYSLSLTPAPVTYPFHLPKLLPFPSSSSIIPITVHFFPIYLFIPSPFSSSVRSTEKIKERTALVVVSDLSLTWMTTRTCLRPLSFPHVPEPFLQGATLLTLLTLLNPLSLL